jgi:dTDP-4-dehydrorhamnose 3,5-epimerase
MDKMNLLSRVVFSPLRKIPNPKGDVWHALKTTDVGFAGFGEAYFTTVLGGTTKGWKRHGRMTMNLLVVAGRVTFHFWDEFSNQGKSISLGETIYGRLTVPPEIWMAFTGAGSELNLILNIASIPHDPEEAVNVPIETFPIEAIK